MGSETSPQASLPAHSAIGFREGFMQSASSSGHCLIATLPGETLADVFSPWPPTQYFAGQSGSRILENQSHMTSLAAVGKGACLRSSPQEARITSTSTTALFPTATFNLSRYHNSPQCLSSLLAIFHITNPGSIHAARTKQLGTVWARMMSDFFLV